MGGRWPLACCWWEKKSVYLWGKICQYLSNFQMHMLVEQVHIYPADIFAHVRKLYMHKAIHCSPVYNNKKLKTIQDGGLNKLQCIPTTGSQRKRESSLHCHVMIYWLEKIYEVKISGIICLFYMQKTLYLGRCPPKKHTPLFSWVGWGTWTR